MSEQVHDKKTIAVTQLETALRLYNEGSDYYSVITLAGAADEILGRMLAAKGKKPFVRALAEGAAEMHRLLFGSDVGVKDFVDRSNRAENTLKHHGPGSPQGTAFDAREEAIDMLDRAVTNYWHLEHNATPAMTAFVDSQRAAV